MIVRPGSHSRTLVMGAGLKKLLKLKDWVTVPEAASHLSTLFGEDVAEADILRFALDGRLTLSVNLVNYAVGRRGKMLPLAEAERKIIQPSSDELYNSINEVDLLNGRVVSFSGGPTIISSGVWDLAMLGAERSEIERKYHLLTGGPTVLSGSLDGLLVNRPDGTWCQLFQGDEAGEYSRAEALPSNAVLVVRTSALQDLWAQVSEPGPNGERPVGQRERTTLLVIIAALAELNGIDVKHPSKAALEIESATIQKGARISARAIEDHLGVSPTLWKGREPKTDAFRNCVKPIRNCDLTVRVGCIP